MVSILPIVIVDGFQKDLDTPFFRGVLATALPGRWFRVRRSLFSMKGKNRVEIRQLKAFATAARLSGFGRAAELLGYAQSSVSAQIQSLEQELGTILFERLGRRVTLTDDGARLLVYAEQILKLETEARAAASGSRVPRGTLTIGAAESLCVSRLPPLFQEYRRRYPDVELILKMGTRPDSTQGLIDNILDVAFIIDRELTVPLLVSEALIKEPMVLVTAPGHPITQKAPLWPPDLQGESLILTEPGCYRDVLDRILAEAGIQPGPLLEFGSIEAIKQLIIRGMGTTLLPRIVVEREIAAGQLADLGWEGPEFRITTQIVRHKDKWLSPAQQALWKLAREMIGNGA